MDHLVCFYTSHINYLLNRHHSRPCPPSSSFYHFNSELIQINIVVNKLFKSFLPKNFFRFHFMVSTLQKIPTFAQYQNVHIIRTILNGPYIMVYSSSHINVLLNGHHSRPCLYIGTFTIRVLSESSKQFPIHKNYL